MPLKNASEMTNMILMKKRRERIREDMQLFIDYYRNLWMKKF